MPQDVAMERVCVVIQDFPAVKLHWLVFLFLIPGPVYCSNTAIHTTQGQLIEITVINQLKGNESIVVHWHGQNQNKTTYADGISDVTQCVVPNKPGPNVMVYKFMPNDAGTFWYHGHYIEQYPDGLYGPLIIHATTPTASIMADTNKWTWMIADWYDVASHSLVPYYLSPASGGDEPIPDSFVVNNKFDSSYFISASQTGAPVLVRVINAAALSMFKISVDGMDLQIVEIDGSPVDPFNVPYFNLNVAQRVAFYLDFSKLNNAAISNSNSIYFRVQGMPDMYPTYNPADTVGLGLYGSSSGKPLNLMWRGIINLKSSGALPTYTVAPPSLLPAPLDSNLLQARPTKKVASVAPLPTLRTNFLVEV